MLKALLWKELRELMPLIVAAILLDSVIIGSAFFDQHRLDAVYVESIWPAMFITSLLYSLVAGLFQNLREEHQGTLLFLMHRPVGREALIATRLVYGAGICAVVCVLPVLWIALWADARNDDRPHWVSLWALSYCGQFLLIYFGAFLSSLRPAKALGSRYLPLVASILLFLVFFVLGMGPREEYLARTISLSLAWILGPLVQVALIVAIFHVARTRDYS